VSLVFSLAGFLYFGLGVVSGPLADRFGSRRLAVAGMLLTGLGLAAASAARSLPEVYAAYGLGVGLGVGCAYVPAIGAVQRWFVRRRGFASGQPQLHGPDPGERDGQHRRRGHCRRDLAGKGAGTDQALISCLTRFLYVNRDPPRIKSGAGFRLKTL
jgi:Major Facilitator Superfamily